jgi:potassium-dependent mechanosensitive channel
MPETLAARWWVAFAGLILFLLCAPLAAQVDSTIDSAHTAVARILAQLESEPPSSDTADQLRGQISDYRRQARDCIVRHESRIEAINRDIETLGPADDAPNVSIDAARNALEQERAQLKDRLASCKLLLVNSDTALGELDSIQEQALAARLNTRTLNVFSLLLDGGRRINWITALTSLQLKHTGLAYLEVWRLSLFIALTAGLLAAGLYGQRRLRASLAVHSPTEDMSGEAAIAFVSTVARYLPVLLVSVGWTLFWIMVVGDARPWPLLAVISFAISGYVLVALISRALFNPPRPARHYLPFDEACSRRFWHTLRLLTLVAAVGAALFQSPFIEGLSEPLLVLLRAVYTPFFVLSLVWTVWLAFTLQNKGRVGLFRPLLTLVLIGALIAEWLGYHALTDYIVGGIFFSLIGLGLAWLLNGLLTDIFDGVDEGRYPWQQQLRARLGLTAGENVPGLVWLRVLTSVVIWGALLLFLLRVWGLSAQGQDVLLRYFYEGFEIGPVNIVPSQLVMALVLFAVLLSVVAWFKKQLDERWLRKSRLEHGARHATITVSGYVGAALAALISLSVAGVDFKNLAIIAGALSVGIGFGLQNIVNNFVSGLILLFERPIRVGDWVVVGNSQTQGYVKRISIRSTQILTFDLADVIVPNSQLISEQVTNWMLRDLRGRVCVPVGVAYGSDTALVKEVLLDVAEQHPAPIRDGSLPEPRVFFLRFGETALEFELRFFIRNVDQRGAVISDINFAIDSAFREAGIQLPYPIRDLRAKSWLTTAAAAAPAPGSALPEDAHDAKSHGPPASGKSAEGRRR